MNNALCVTCFYLFFYKILNRMNGQMRHGNSQLRLKCDGGSSKQMVQDETTTI